ncbi:DUF4395 domain-containing protein [Ferruginibacter sp.]
MATELECPVDFVTVNENKVRLIALHVLILGIIFIVFPHWGIAAFLTIDFFLRGFNFGKYSLLGIISQKEVELFKVRSKPIDQAPKRFAAKIGFFFSAAITITSLLDYGTAAMALAGILVVFALLESFLGICAGCYVYTYYKKFFGRSVQNTLNSKSA